MLDELVKLRIVTALNIVGWLVIVISSIYLLFSILAPMIGIPDAEAGAVFGFSAGGCISGLMLLGFSAIIKKLCEIENHLKQSKPQMPL